MQNAKSAVPKVPSYMRSKAALITPRKCPVGIPQDFLLRDLREKRKFRMLSRKLTVFVTFVGVYLAVLLLDRNISARSTVRGIISKQILNPTMDPNITTFENIDSIYTYWDWFRNAFLPLMYSTTDSEGIEKNSDELYTIATHTIIVGGFHLLQTRYKSLNASDPDNKSNGCYSEFTPLQNEICFSSSEESEERFGWTDGTNASYAELLTLDMFTFTANNDSEKGFQTYFLRSSTNGTDEKAKANLMHDHRWLDKHTKIVAITLPLFNYNLKIWSIVHLTVEFDLAGGVTPMAFIHVTNIQPYDMNYAKNVVRVVLEAIFVAHVIYFTLLEIWDIYVLSNGNIRVYMARYGIINNIGDMANIIINITIIIWRICSQHNSTREKMLALPSFDEYVSAMELAYWDEILLGLNLLNILLLSGRALKYFQVTKGGLRLMNSVYGAMPDVMSFLPIYFAVIIGFTFAGHMIYGLSFPEWSTFPRAFFRVFELNFGLYDPGPIYDEGGLWSAVFIYASNVVFCILLLNVFMAIVMSTWDEFADRETEKHQEREQYSRQLGLTDTFYLILMHEDIIDTLVTVVMDFEGQEFVTKTQLVHAWTEYSGEILPWIRNRVLGWYWEIDGKAEAEQMALGHDSNFSRTVKALMAKPSTRNLQITSERGNDDDDAAAVVVKSPRDLELDDPLRFKPSQNTMAASVKKPASAKVIAYNPPNK